jgi:hypothetical protein
MTLAELKATIEAEALRRQAARDGFTLDAVKSFLGQGLVLPRELRPEPPTPPHPLTYRYFQSLHGRQLVTSCYNALLGRGPDPGGMAHYLELLARGEDKALVVGSIAYSAEGRQRKARVRGLMPRFAIALSRRVPVAGALVAWIVAIATVHRRQREAMAFEQQVQARLDAIAEYVGQSGNHVAMKIDALRAVMESRD